MFIVTELSTHTKTTRVLAVLRTAFEATNELQVQSNRHSQKNSERKRYEVILVDRNRAEVYSRTYSWLGDYKVLEFVYMISDFAETNPQCTIFPRPPTCDHCTIFPQSQHNTIPTSSSAQTQCVPEQVEQPINQ